MRVAVIGSSHVAAWKLAWDSMDVGKGQRHELVFFASRGANLLRTEVSSDVIVPTEELVRADLRHTSGGEDRIDPKEFDCFLIVGLFPFKIFEIDKPWYSRSIFDQLLLDFVKGRGAFYLTSLLRSITIKPIFVAHEPLPARPIDASLFERFPYLEQIDAINRGTFEGVNARLLPQPRETIFRGLRTYQKYSNGSESLDVGDDLSRLKHRPGEFLHMNKDFGDVFLQQFLNALDSV